jgi:hypothetical protein
VQIACALCPRNAQQSYAALFDAMLPRSEVTYAAARALRFQADEIERRGAIEVAGAAARTDTAGCNIT